VHPNTYDSPNLRDSSLPEIHATILGLDCDDDAVGLRSDVGNDIDRMN